MAVFPVESMAEKYARRICEKLKDLGVVTNVEDCVTKVKSAYSGILKEKDIDKRWAEGIKARYGL